MEKEEEEEEDEEKEEEEEEAVTKSHEGEVEGNRILRRWRQGRLQGLLPMIFLGAPRGSPRGAHEEKIFV